MKHVKDLYHKRASDVRILIPVLTGLEKKEVVEVLPKLIKQSPNVVKEVFNRLLGCFHGGYWPHLSSLSCNHSYTLAGAYILVLAGGCSFKIRPTHRSIDRLTTHINTVEIRWMIISCD